MTITAAPFSVADIAAGNPAAPEPTTTTSAERSQWRLLLVANASGAPNVPIAAPPNPAAAFCKNPLRATPFSFAARLVISPFCCKILVTGPHSRPQNGEAYQPDGIFRTKYK